MSGSWRAKVLWALFQGAEFYDYLRWRSPDRQRRLRGAVGHVLPFSYGSAIGFILVIFDDDESRHTGAKLAAITLGRKVCTWAMAGDISLLLFRWATLMLGLYPACTVSPHASYPQDIWSVPFAISPVKVAFGAFHDFVSRRHRTGWSYAAE